jgi:molybdenum cofactor cytidylyltransferase
MSLIVVTGAYADKIKSELEGIEARLVHNSDWEKGMGASVATAFNYLLSEKALFDAAIICPADMPLVGASQFQRLIDAHQQSPQRIIVSDLGEAQGPPCLFPRSYFEELAKLCGPQGARTLLIEHKAAISSISMPEATMDVDTTEDYARLIHQQCSA